MYISVQNELVAAYNELRNREFLRLYPQENMDYVQADRKYTDPRTDKKVKEKLNLNKDSNIMLIGCEGDTDKAMYQKLINQ